MFVPETTSRPPDGLVIPHDEQLIFTILTHLPFFYSAYVALANLFGKGDPVCLLFLIGGTISCVFEPIIDVLGFCYFPRPGNWVAYEWHNRPIPLFVPATYGWFVGGLGYWVLTLFQSGTMTRRGLWLLWLRNFAFNLILEYPALYWGMYVYYGHQPFEVAGFPLWFPACHALAPLVSATVVHVLRHELTGVAALAIIPTVTSTYGMANIGGGWPVWIALSVDKGIGDSYLGGFGTVFLLAVSIWTLSTAFPKTLGARPKPHYA
ncbi:hypothetical protein BJY00DRAFT_313241 [Aspergillus carlsbadensis]|nr:hypothetical protein BJY00DRAFT_313241 [Aspergillus carlsbadensis]